MQKFYIILNTFYNNNRVLKYLYDPWFIYLIIKHVVVNRIKAINASLARITEGNLNEVVNVRSNEEFTSLSDDINSTVDTLKSYISEASARIDKELDYDPELMHNSEDSEK